MRRNISFVLFMLLLIFLIGCNEMENYVTEEPFVIASWSPAGPDHVRNFYPRKVSISNNHTLILYTEPTKDITIGDDAPMVEIHLKEDEVEKIKETIIKNQFWKLNAILDSESQDGRYSYITVNLTDRTKTVGGLNPPHANFNEIFDNIFDLVDSDTYKTWNKKVKEYILEMNPELE